MQSDMSDHCHTDLHISHLSQDCAVESDISPFFITIGAFKSLHSVSVQHNVSMYAFEAAVLAESHAILNALQLRIYKN